MIRNVGLEEISDGRLYDADDMVRADCQGCRGCSACCRGMGTSIVLDPLDVFRLTAGLQKPFAALLENQLELNVVDGIILPDLKMNGDGEACAFLDENGRCRIHEFRPGICRLFPLGRFYEDGGFRYFLQIHECRHKSRSKIKVRKWLDTPELGKYETFISQWHYFLKDLAGLAGAGESFDEGRAKQVSMYLLQKFYLDPFDGSRDFYEQFEKRLAEARAVLL